MDNEKLNENIENEEDSNIVELVDENGNATQFFLIETREYKGKPYAILSPAEEVEGLDEDTVLIFEISGDDESGLLLPIEDEVLIEEIYNEFMADVENDGEFVD